VNSFTAELCALVAVWRGKDTDMASMVASLQAEIDALNKHIANERRTATDVRDQSTDGSV
jgi:hypothetical protein